jgi:hypothetical protein
MKTTRLLLIADAAAGLPQSPAPVPQPPKLTCDPAAIATNIEAHIKSLEKDASALTPLLGFALTNLRGALNAIQGHVKAATPQATAGAEE